jgi:hypothetical protein
MLMERCPRLGNDSSAHSIQIPYRLGKREEIYCTGGDEKYSTLPLVITLKHVTLI